MLLTLMHTFSPKNVFSTRYPQNSILFRSVEKSRVFGRTERKQTCKSAKLIIRFLTDWLPRLNQCNFEICRFQKANLQSSCITFSFSMEQMILVCGEKAFSTDATAHLSVSQTAQDAENRDGTSDMVLTGRKAYSRIDCMAH